MDKVREPAVANMFYTGNPAVLSSQISEMVDNAIVESKYNNVFGIVSPHAGYVYSGGCAAYAYKALAGQEFDTAIVLSPSHREYFYGVSVYDGDAYQTPLGTVHINSDIRDKIISCSDLIFAGKSGHGEEHAVEVQLPFLQYIKNDVKIVPMVIGDQRKDVMDQLAEALAEVKNETTIVVASTDLSHFYSKDIASKIDGRTEERISNFEFDELQKDLEQKNCEACGGGGVVALLKAARKLNYAKADVLCHTDSGDVSGDNSSVVGYLSAVVYK